MIVQGIELKSRDFQDLTKSALPQHMLPHLNFRSFQQRKFVTATAATAISSVLSALFAAVPIGRFGLDTSDVLFDDGPRFLDDTSSSIVKRGLDGVSEHGRNRKATVAVVVVAVKIHGDASRAPDSLVSPRFGGVAFGRRGHAMYDLEDVYLLSTS